MVRTPATSLITLPLRWASLLALGRAAAPVQKVGISGVSVLSVFGAATQPNAGQARSYMDAPSMPSTQFVKTQTG